MRQNFLIILILFFGFHAQHVEGAFQHEIAEIAKKAEEAVASASTDSSIPPDQTEQEILNSLSIQQKVGQLLMIGFDGEVPTEGLKDQIQGMNVGSVILFPRNIKNQKQVLTLTKSIQALNKSPLPISIATDEEGGRVIRFYKDETIMPGELAIGAAGSTKLAYEVGRSTAARLATLGINMNLAPVLDLNIVSENRTVGSRSFGEDPAAVSLLGASYIEGVQSLGVSATAKHFPGHGKTKLDSHKTLPQINSSLENDLIPFQEAINKKVDLIMTAHVSYPKLDKSGAPATLSSKIITELLRGKLKYDGVVVTDDLEMGAIEQKHGIGEAAVLSVLAGCDLIIVGWHTNKQEEAYKALLKAVESGRITTERLNESVIRIAKLKLRKLSDLKIGVNNSEVEKVFGEGKEKGKDNKIAHSITTESATLLKNINHTLPLVTKYKRTLVVSPLYELYREIRRRSDNVYYLEMNLRPDANEKKRIIKYINESSKNADQIVIGVINKHHAEIVSKISKKIKIPVVVVSFDSPHYLKGFPNIDAFLCVYHYRTGAAETAARIILGNLQAKGSLPISVDKKDVGYGQQIIQKEQFVRYD